MPVARKVGTCLWFETGGPEAARFYTSLYSDSAVTVAQRLDIAGLGAAHGGA